MLAEPSSDGAELDVRIARSLAMYLRDSMGPEVLERVAEAGGFESTKLLTGKGWAPLTSVAQVLEEAWKVLGRDEGRFKEAARYRLADAYGAVRFVFLATSPKRVYLQAAKTVHLVSNTSRYEVVDESRTTLTVRYHSAVAHRQTRPLCLTRQANIIGMPVIWGLPPALVSEDGCLAQGDPWCEYRIQWNESPGWISMAAGALLGCAASLGLSLAGLGHPVGWGALVALGTLAGYASGLRRAHRANVALAGQTGDAFKRLAQDEADARQELLHIHQRQNEWTHLLEQQVAERTAQLSTVVRRMEALQSEKTALVRGYAHDLRNPFTVLRNVPELLRPDRERSREDWNELMTDYNDALAAAERMVEELWTAIDKVESVTLRPERLDTPSLAEKLRRRLRALTFGRDIRVSVFSTREAPEAIQTDLLVFDRVVDNLLTNAAKYTERGSIVAELSAVPGYLTIKLSDTGRGIAEDDIDKIFQPGGSKLADRAPGSYGFGLSVTVRLLSEIGGRLEVMSKPGEGTTFWIYFPVETAGDGVQLLLGDNTAGRAAGGSNVVRIRRVMP